MKKNLLVKILSISGCMLVASGCKFDGPTSDPVNNPTSDPVNNQTTLTPDEHHEKFTKDLMSFTNNVKDSCFNYDTVKDLSYTFNETVYYCESNEVTYIKTGETEPTTEVLYDVENSTCESCFKVKRINGVVTICIETNVRQNIVNYTVQDNALIKTEQNKITKEVFSYSKNEDNFQQQFFREKTIDGTIDNTYSVHKYYNFDNEDTYKQEVKNVLSYNLGLIISELYDALQAIMVMYHYQILANDVFSKLDYYYSCFSTGANGSVKESGHYQELVKKNSVEEKFENHSFNDSYFKKDSKFSLEGSEFTLNTDVTDWSNEQSSYNATRPTIMSQGV